MGKPQIYIIREYPSSNFENTELVFQLCQYSSNRNEFTYGYRFAWKTKDGYLTLEDRPLPSVSKMMELTAIALKEGWGHFTSESTEEIKKLIPQTELDSVAVESPLRFPVGSFILREGEYYQVLDNLNDFVGRCIGLTGEIHSTFYFQYNHATSTLVTDESIIKELQETLDKLVHAILPTKQEMLDIGFVESEYDGEGYYEWSITDADRATEVAELAEMKFDKLSGVHHVILQCRVDFTNCVFFCDHDYWEVASDVFIELVQKLLFV